MERQNTGAQYEIPSEACKHSLEVAKHVDLVSLDLCFQAELCTTTYTSMEILCALFFADFLDQDLYFAYGNSELENRAQRFYSPEDDKYVLFFPRNCNMGLYKRILLLGFAALTFCPKMTFIILTTKEVMHLTAGKTECYKLNELAIPLVGPAPNTEDSSDEHLVWTGQAVNRVLDQFYAEHYHKLD